MFDEHVEKEVEVELECFCFTSHKRRTPRPHSKLPGDTVKPLAPGKKADESGVATVISTP